MGFTHFIENVVKFVEGFGVLILVVGGLGVFARLGYDALSPERRVGAYDRTRRELGRVILLGLEVLIVADIIRTVIVDQTPSSVAVLAVIVAVRIVLSWSLVVEIDGVWPWQQSRHRHKGEH